MRVYLIDGYSLLYRAFYALPQSIVTTSGLPTNALYGFTSMILKLLDEADDVLATLSKRVPEGMELGIVTGDQDAMQLVDGNVKVLRTTRGVSELKSYGREEVIEEYGVTPEQIPDYKALTGDPSDNIPGVRGIGPKGASGLLREFETVENLYENLNKVGAKGTRKKLEEGRENAFVSLQLARMRFDVPVEFDAEALRFEGVAPESREVLRRYEFRSLEPRFAALPVAGGEEFPPVERLEVRVSEEPVDLSFEPVAAAPVGDGRWCVAVADDEVRVSEEVPERPLTVHDAKRFGVRGA